MDRQPLNEQEQAARQELVLLLHEVLDGHCSYLEAAVRTLQLRPGLGGVGEFDDDFKAFVSISSETDHLPTQAARHLWAEHAVRALEPEINRSEVWAADLASGSCAALLARFAETST